jgi:hypothetical protein
LLGKGKETFARQKNENIFVETGREKREKIGEEIMGKR